jgi:hypothetical protein
MSAGPLAATVAAALTAGEFIPTASERPVTFFGDTAIRLAGACRRLTVGAAGRAERLSDSVDSAAQQAHALGLEVAVLAEGVGRPQRCHAASCRARGTASARVSAGVCEAPRRVDRAAAAPELLGRGATAQRVAALARVGISLDPRPALDARLPARRFHLAQAARGGAVPVSLGVGGPPRTDTRSSVTVVRAGPLGVTLREVPASGGGGQTSLHVGEVQPGSAVGQAARAGAQLVAVNGTDCRVVMNAAARKTVEDMLRLRPVKLEFECARPSIFEQG